LLTAARHAAGALPAPEQLGARPMAICRLSGLRAGPHCPVTTEWFLAGTAPPRYCDWHGENGAVTLPARYADWAEHARLAAVIGERSAARPAADTVGSLFRITSPAAGDVFRFVPGVPAEYATVGLRAAGASRAGPVRWFVDGRPVPSVRLPLRPGRHRVRAEAGSLHDEVEIEVIGPH
jgi:penicillin-binding protein 1C